MLACIWSISACVTPHGAPNPSSCDNPSSAADSLLTWQHAEHFDMDMAIACVEPVPGMDTRHLASHLKQVLDARGLYVPVHSMSTDADYLNEDQLAEVRPFGSIFPLVLRRGDDGEWRYARETMEQVPRLYGETFSQVAQALLQRLPPVFSRAFMGFQLWQALFAVLLLGISWITSRVVRDILKERVLTLARRFDVDIDPKKYAETNTPLTWFATLYVLSWGVPQLQLSIDVSRFLVTSVSLGARLAGIVAALRFIDVCADVATRWAAHTSSRLDDQLIPLVRSAGRTFTLLLGLVVILETGGVDVWKLMAGLSIGSLVIALAAQDTVANLFGSINVFVDRPFQIGDWVKIKGVEGVVEEVGFRSTRIRTFYNSQVTMPNSALTNTNVDNMGRRPRRRVKMTLSLTYQTPPDKVQAYVEGVRAILAAHQYVERTYEVHLYAMSESSLDILVYYHLVVPGWHEELSTRSQNILEFLRLASELGVDFAYPSSTIHVASTPSEPQRTTPAEHIAELEALAASFGPGGEHARPGGVPFSRSFTFQALDTGK
jgi:MscS family membrane protein